MTWQASHRLECGADWEQGSPPPCPQWSDGAWSFAAVSAGLGHTLEPEPRRRAAPYGFRFPSWGVGTGEGGERSAGQESGRFAGLSTCLGPVKPRVLTAGANASQRLGPSGLLGRLLFALLIGYLLHRGRVLVPFRPMKSTDFEDLSLEFRGFLRG